MQDVSSLLNAQESAPPDSTAVDSAAAADTTSVVEEIGRGVGEAAELIREGRGGEIWISFRDKALDYIPEVISALIVLLFFFAVYRVVDSVARRLMVRSRRVPPDVIQLLTRLLRFIVIAIGAVMVVGELGFDVTALVTGLGIVGLALGFAAKDTLENLIAGFTVLLDRPFMVGDNIVVDGVFGTVTEITLRSTRIRTLNNEIAIIPNAQMINHMVVNHTKLGLLRVEVPFGIAYKESPEEARAVVMALTEGDDRLNQQTHPPQVVVTQLGASSVDMSLRIWLENPRDEIPIRFEYQEKVFTALKAADIEIPFPHLQLFIDEAEGLKGLGLNG
ncbi:MAG: mechanosensitive ion channel family protein [Bacteroidota bacterium]